MIKFILKRLSLLIPTLFGVVTLVFAMIALAPGDPARVMLGERATKETVERLRRDLGLDRPLIEQYANDPRNFVKKAVNWALRNIGKKRAALRAEAVACAKRLTERDSASARWIGRDAIKEFEKKFGIN